MTNHLALSEVYPVLPIPYEQFQTTRRMVGTDMINVCPDGRRVCCPHDTEKHKIPRRIEIKKRKGRQHIVQKTLDLAGVEIEGFNGVLARKLYFWLELDVHIPISDVVRRHSLTLAALYKEKWFHLDITNQSDSYAMVEKNPDTFVARLSESLPATICVAFYPSSEAKTPIEIQCKPSPEAVLSPTHPYYQFILDNDMYEFELERLPTLVASLMSK